MVLPYVEFTQLPPMGMWSFNVGENLVYGDHVLAFYFGVDEQEAAGGLPIEAFYNSIHPDDIDRVRKEIAETCAGRSNFRCEYSVLGRDKKWRRILATGHCFYDGGHPVQYPGSVIEIDGLLDSSKDALIEVIGHTNRAKIAASRDNNTFIVYILNMALVEIGRQEASRQVNKLLTDTYVNPHFRNRI